MYPGTIVTWHDSSVVQPTTVETVDNSPLFLVVSSFDRGPEKLVETSGRNFYNLFGNKMNFDKHGQPALQAANMIDHGARLLVKRLVADDAKLANLIAVATVKRQITALNTTPDDPNGKTIDEILDREPVEKYYAEKLSIISTIGVVDNTTTLTVEPSLTSGNNYYWVANDDDTMPELDTVINPGDYTLWDGISEIAVVDGTKIRLLEVDADYKIKKCGIITVVSKIPHPTTVSTNPETDLPAAVASSREGSAEGFTYITISGSITEGNEYFYSATADMPVNEQEFTADEIAANWTRFGAELTGEIEIADATELVFVEFQAGEEDTLKAVKGFSIVTCSKLPADTRSSESIDPIIPTDQKYTVASSDNVIKWSAVSINNCKTLEEVKAAAAELLVINDPIISTTETGVIIDVNADYPLICMTDNGRGVTSKSFKISPDLSISKDMGNMYYNITIFDGTTSIEKCTGALNPDTLYAGKNYGLSEDTSEQVVLFNVENAYDEYVDIISDITGIEAEQLYSYDLINATDSRGVAIAGIVIDNESIDFGTSYGVNLDNGDNGSFGDAPFGTEAYIAKAVEAFEGQFDDAIWDVDTYKISAVFDANYPKEVKEAIAKFVTFREDCAFFRDYGLDIFSYAAIINYSNDIAAEYKNKFINDYFTTYQIYNPETKKRIRVTMIYDLAANMVRHFANGCYRPVAGTANDMVLESAIPGTINFTPRITPSVNQKALLDTARINYAIFENEVCVVQSTYTSQKDFTQLSFTNNVLAIQEVIRAVRTTCPKQRYTFTTGSDFTLYADAVNSVLTRFQSNFAELSFDYEQNSLMAAQKIFYATLYFRFNNWAQTESFDIYALPNE